MNGGTMERLYADSVLPAFEKAHNVKVVYRARHLGGHPRQVKASPQRASARDHVMFLDDGIMYRAIA